MARALWLPDVLSDAGLSVVAEPGWATRGSEDFDPQIILWHHTAGPRVGDFPSRNVLINGRPGLPGPLVQVGMSRSCVFHLIASGKANHAGVGEWQGFSGNRQAIGLEVENVGTTAEPWTPKQIESMVTFSASISLHLDLAPIRTCGHKEYARPAGRKIDPHTLDMKAMRRLVDKACHPSPHPPIVTAKDTPMVVQHTGKPQVYILAGGHLVKLTSNTSVNQKLKALGQPAIVRYDDAEWKDLISVCPIVPRVSK
jgi:hypothetical protein